MFLPAPAPAPTPPRTRGAAPPSPGSACWRCRSGGGGRRATFRRMSLVRAAAARCWPAARAAARRATLSRWRAAVRARRRPAARSAFRSHQSAARGTPRLRRTLARAAPWPSATWTLRNGLSVVRARRSAANARQSEVSCVPSNAGLLRTLRTLGGRDVSSRDMQLPIRYSRSLGGTQRRGRAFPLTTIPRTRALRKHQQPFYRQAGALRHVRFRENIFVSIY